MATIDWPGTRAFTPRSVTFGVESAKSRFQGAFTNNREVVPHLASRLVATLTLGSVVTAQEADERAAFLMALESTADWVRFGPLHRLVNRGTLAGNPLVGAAGSAGTRSLTLKRVRQAGNLLTHVMAFDQAPWVNTATVTVNTTANPTNGVVNADTITDTSTTVTQRVTQAVSVPADTATYTFSIYVLKTSGGTAPTFSPALQFTGGASPITLQPRVNTDTGAVLSGTATVTSVGSWWRVSVTGANDGTHTTCTVFAFPAFGVYGSSVQDVTTTGAKVVWGAQLEIGSAPTAVLTGARVQAGDMLSVGGNLLMVSAEAASNSTGNLVVPLALELPADVTVDTPVEVISPTGVWELATDGIALDYSRGSVQQGIALPFRQVVV